MSVSCKMCEKIIVEAGAVDVCVKSRRKAHSELFSMRRNGPKRHLVRRMSSVRDISHRNKCEFDYIVHNNIPAVSVLRNQSACGICSLDLRIYTHETAIKSSLILLQSGEIACQQSVRGNISVSDASATFIDSTYCYEDLSSICTIGTGTFGRVKLVQHTPTGEVFALKIMSKANIVAFKQHRNVITEKQFLLECSKHPFFIRLFGTYNLQNQLCMLMEYVQGGELLTHMYDRSDTVPRSPLGGFHLDSVRFYSANIVLALEYLHSRNIAYRDLKPENVVIDRQGYLKLIDFGFAKRIPSSSASKTYTVCGTPDYLAPEVVLSKGYDKAADLWALGCLMFELNVGDTPFSDEFITQIYQKISASEKHLSFPEGMDGNLCSIIKAFLQPDSALRLGNMKGGFLDIMKHGFFCQLEWDALRDRTHTPDYVPVLNSETDTSNFFNFDDVTQAGDGIIEDIDEEYSGNQNYFEAF